MKPEKILELAQKNKDRGNEYENRESTRSELLGYLVTILVGTFLFFLEYFIKDSVNLSLSALCMTATGVPTFYKGLKQKKIHLIALGVIAIMLALTFIIFSIIQVVSA